MTGRVAKRRRETVAEQMAEMIALEALSKQRPLTAAESERLGVLVLREQRRSYYRPQRIAHLRAELALLESLEIAARGAEALPEPREIEMVEVAPRSWAAPDRRAA